MNEPWPQGAVGWGYVFAPGMGAVLTYAPPRIAAAAPFDMVACMLTMSAVVSAGMDFTPVEEEEGERKGKGRRGEIVCWLEGGLLREGRGGSSCWSWWRWRRR
jgi:hypothetical protein